MSPQRHNEHKEFTKNRPRLFARSSGENRSCPETPLCLDKTGRTGQAEYRTIVRTLADITDDTTLRSLCTLVLRVATVDEFPRAVAKQQAADKIHHGDTETGQRAGQETG